MASRTSSVLIVGAGPTGLTAALELARRGYEPRIIDRDEGPTPLSKAVGISPHSLDLLQASGVSDRLNEAGIKIRNGHVWSASRRLASIDFTLLQHRYNFLLSLPQSETESIMEAELRRLGPEVEWNTNLTGFTQAQDHLLAHLNGPWGAERTRFDFVFGADGLQSTVRDEVEIAFDGYVHERIWSIADAELESWEHPPDSAQLFLHDSGDLGFIIAIGPNRYRAVSNTQDAFACIPGRYRISTMLRADTFRLPIRQAWSYQSGTVFLGGDAAHVQSPVGARGMNLGIEDAADFARRFVHDDLDGYTRARRPVGERWIRRSERVLALAQATRPLPRWSRSLALGFVDHAPWLQRTLVERVAGLKE